MLRLDLTTLPPLKTVTDIDGEVIVVTVSSSQELDDFRRMYKRHFPYAATANEFAIHPFLEQRQFVFGRTREAVVRTVLRWDQLGIQCVWVDEDGEGLWCLKNLPFGLTEESLFEIGMECYSDPSMAVEQVASLKIDEIYNIWEVDSCSDVRAYTKSALLVEVQELRDEEELFAAFQKQDAPLDTAEEAMGISLRSDA